MKYLVSYGLGRIILGIGEIVGGACKWVLSQEGAAYQWLRKFYRRLSRPILTIGVLESTRVSGIYVINLPYRTERMEQFYHRLKGSKIPVHPIEAVCGKQLDPKVLSEVRRGGAEALSPGQIGCYLSHRRCWERIVEEGCEVTWVMEDDAKVNHLISNQLDAWIAEVEEQDPNWEMIYTGRSTPDHFYEVCEANEILGHVPPESRDYDQPFSPNTVVPGPSTHLYGYLLSQRGAKKLLELTESIRTPVDIEVALNRKSLALYALKAPLTEEADTGVHDSR